MKRRNFSTLRKKAKGVKVLDQDLLREHQLDPIAEKEMELLNGKVSPSLYGLLMMVPRGFDETMQLEIAENIVEFAANHVAFTTGVDSADIVLDVCYLMIANDHNILRS